MQKDALGKALCSTPSVLLSDGTSVKARESLALLGPLMTSEQRNAALRNLAQPRLGDFQVPLPKLTKLPLSQRPATPLRRTPQPPVRPTVSPSTRDVKSVEVRGSQFGAIAGQRELTNIGKPYLSCPEDYFKGT